MKTIVYNGPLDIRYGDVYVALGNFDGVHLGHQKLITEMVKKARASQGTAVVATFHPHPLRLIRPEAAPKLITPMDVKAGLLGRLGVDIVLILPFNPDLAKLSPEEFVQQVLHQDLRAELVLVGFNYSFGRGGKGTPELLWELGHRLGVRVRVIDAVTIAGEPVSSTAVRAALEKGDIERAADLLGYMPILRGPVVPGDQRGRNIGFRTANIELPPEQYLPARGVYAAWVRSVSLSEGILAVVNIGVKPTFGTGLAETVEAHLIDFEGDLYGQTLTLHLLRRMRPEMRFQSPEQLVEQIHRDLQDTRHFFHAQQEHIFANRIIEI
ncbi:bifunctional riboflavin kinase/FAD synthetase [Heliomicrobium modesticaldum]|uniref:bifunctional riboflavin kinase/FAD synthetase n=1 Tax=Heliomicrobium modesticaldum TaxID=35701 RepID=UPI0002F287E7|nr:bifunctional riboflavin kinase/FAD synthetase [Heliomicrobium modesticaldum]